MWGLVPGQLDALQKTGGSTETDSVLPLKGGRQVQSRLGRVVSCSGRSDVYNVGKVNLTAKSEYFPKLLYIL